MTVVNLQPTATFHDTHSFFLIKLTFKIDYLGKD